MRIAVLVVTFIMIGLPVPAAAWATNGVPVCSITGTQQSPAIASLGASGSIITWADRRGLDYDIYAQKLDSNGIPQWASGGVAVCRANYDQQFPVAVSDGTGGVIIVWQDARLGDDGLDIYSQRINVDGVCLWQADGAAVCVHPEGATDPPAAFSLVVTPDDAGGAIIAWRDTRADPIAGNTEIYAQRIDITGAPVWTVNGVKLMGFTTQKWATRSPTIAPDGSGGAIVLWQDARNLSTTGNDLYASHVAANGLVDWTANGVPVCTQVGEQSYPDMMPLGSGSVAIVWEDKRSGSYHIYAQRLDSTGAGHWGNGGRLICSAASEQRTPRIVGDGSSGCIVVWTDKRNGTTETDIYGQRLDGSGALSWDSVGKPICIAPGSQSRIRMCSGNSGSALITFLDTRDEVAVGVYDVFAQMVGSSGSVLLATEGVPLAALTGSTQRIQQVTDDGSGGLCAVWEDDRNAGDWDVYAVHLPGLMAVGSIHAAKEQPDGTLIQLPARLVTGSFDGFFYVEETQRQSGMKIVWPQQVHQGDLVTVTGEMLTSCERYIDASAVDVVGSEAVPRPIGMPTARLGGSPGDCVPAVGASAGLSNVGLLVTVWGRVVDRMDTPSVCITVRDGSTDTKCYGANTADVDDYVMITGICSCETTPSGAVATVLIRDADDVRKLF